MEENHGNLGKGVGGSSSFRQVSQQFEPHQTKPMFVESFETLQV